MMLSDIRSYLQKHHRVTLMDLGFRFDMDADALRPMLERFERKGQLRRINPTGGGCEGCTKCAAASFEIFEWTGKDAPKAH